MHAGGDLSSGPHACVTGALPTEPAPHSSLSLEVIALESGEIPRCKRGGTQCRGSDLWHAAGLLQMVGFSSYPLFLPFTVGAEVSGNGMLLLPWWVPGSRATLELLHQGNLLY